MNLLEAILFLGFVQGIILIAVLLRKSRKFVGYRFLAGIVFIITLAILSLILESLIDYNLAGFDGWFVLVNFPFHPIMLLGPFIYFFSLSFVEKKLPKTRLKKLHYLPVILDLLPFITSLFLMVLTQFLSIEFELANQFIDRYHTYIDIPRCISFTVYLFASWRFTKSDQMIIERYSFNWLRNFIVLLAIIDLLWIVFLFFYISSSEALIASVYYYPIYLPMVVLLYYLSIRMMTDRNSLKSIGVDKSSWKENLQKLNEAMEELKLYANTNLKLSDLGKASGVSMKEVSLVLNNYLKRGFNDYVNEFRIKEALIKLNSEEIKIRTLESIAYEVGFSSRATFYRAFKKIVSKTPSEYLEDKN